MPPSLHFDCQHDLEKSSPNPAAWGRIERLDLMPRNSLYNGGKQNMPKFSEACQGLYGVIRFALKPGLQSKTSD